jgi:SAM-dependent methyltransferase
LFDNNAIYIGRNTMGNAEQIEYWNGEAGKRWAREDSTMARLLAPISEALLDHAAVEGCRNALDIGCGGGSQSLLLARRLGAGASVLGVDVSEPMLEVARTRCADAGANTAQLGFVQADAAAHDFAPASFDLLFSRFGVMFFDDPIAAFTNLREALQAQGRLAFCCWQGLQYNDWTHIPLQAALAHVPPPERVHPHAPGPFAFADPRRIDDILRTSGFSNIDVQPFATTLQFGEAPDLQHSVRELAMIGPVSRLLAGQPPEVLARVLASIEEAVAPSYQQGALALPGAIWLVTATA